MPPVRLVERARAMVVEGKLPNEFAHEFFGGDADNQICALCDKEIKPPDLLACYEPTGARVQTERTLCFHIECFHAWQSAITARR